MGGVSGLDQGTDRADDAGAMDHDEPAAVVAFALDEEGSTDWWSPPPWNKKKDRASVLDVERLLRRPPAGNPASSLELAERRGESGLSVGRDGVIAD